MKGNNGESRNNWFTCSFCAEAKGRRMYLKESFDAKNARPGGRSLQNVSLRISSYAGVENTCILFVLFSKLTSGSLDEVLEDYRIYLLVHLCSCTMCGQVDCDAHTFIRSQAVDGFLRNRELFRRDSGQVLRGSHSTAFNGPPLIVGGFAILIFVRIAIGVFHADTHLPVPGLYR